MAYYPGLEMTEDRRALRDVRGHPRLLGEVMLRLLSAPLLYREVFGWCHMPSSYWGFAFAPLRRCS